VKGQLYSMSIFPKEQLDATTGKPIGKKQSPTIKYFVLDPINGDVICFRKESDYQAALSDKAVFIKLQHVLCAWGPSSRDEMKKANLNSIELSFANESVLLLGAYDSD
jgi:hypothetical protein